MKKVKRQQRKEKLKWFLGAIIVLILSIRGFIDFTDTKITKGTVSYVQNTFYRGEGEYDQRNWVLFNDNSGTERLIKYNTSFGGLERQPNKGDHVTIRYNIDDPQEATTTNYFSYYLSPIIFFLLSLLLFWMSFNA